MVSLNLGRGAPWCSRKNNRISANNRRTGKMSFPVSFPPGGPAASGVEFCKQNIEVARNSVTEGACGTKPFSLATFQPIFPYCRALPHPTSSGAPSRREPWQKPNRKRKICERKREEQAPPLPSLEKYYFSVAVMIFIDHCFKRKVSDGFPQSW